jgi:hypothetical protein
MFASPLAYAKYFTLCGLMLSTGIATIVAGIVYMIVSNSTIKSKLIGLTGTIFVAILSFVATPSLRSISMRMYIFENNDELHQIINIYSTCKAPTCNHNTYKSSSRCLTREDQHKIEQLKVSTEVYTVISDSSQTYFGLFGFMNTRIGIWYTTDGTKPEAAHHFTKLSKNWYY